MNFCHNCGGKLQENPKFCPHCGVKLNDSKVILKTEGAQKEDTKTTSVRRKEMGRYIYPIVAGLIFILIFGSRALWTSYKNNDVSMVSNSDVSMVSNKDVKELLLDKNWMLASYSNLTISSNNDVWSQSALESELNEMIDNPASYIRYKRAPKCQSNRIIKYDQSFDEELGEYSYGISVFEVSKKKGKHRLYHESNKIHSIGIGSYIDNVWEIDEYNEESLITQINEKTLKISLHYYVKTLDGAFWKINYDLVYQAIEDGDKSVMVKANHEITDDWSIVDCNTFMITPKIGTKTYNELEAIDESYYFDFDLSEAEFDFDEI
jgi:hypothetical protein